MNIEISVSATVTCESWGDIEVSVDHRGVVLSQDGGKQIHASISELREVMDVAEGYEKAKTAAVEATR